MWLKKLICFSYITDEGTELDGHAAECTEPDLHTAEGTEPDLHAAEGIELDLCTAKGTDPDLPAMGTLDQIFTLPRTRN